MSLLRSLYPAAAGLLLSASCSAVTDPEPVSHVGVGDRLPQFDIRLSDGSRLTTDSLAGSRSLIVLFNTSCEDCRRELPIVMQLSGELPSLRIVCIARSESASSIESYWRDSGLTLPWSAQPDARVYSLFATGIIPRLYAADSTLTITHIWTESASLEQLRRLATE